MNNPFPFHHFVKSTATANSAHNSSNPGDVFHFEDPAVRPIQAKNLTAASLNAQEIAQIGQEVLKCLEQEVGQEKFQTYFESSLNLESIDNRQVSFSCSTSFIHSVITSHYSESVEKAVAATLGDGYQCQLLGPNARPSDDSIAAKKAKAKTPSFNLDFTPAEADLQQSVEREYFEHVENSGQSRIDQSIDHKKTFANFIVGPSNNMAYASCLSASKSPGKAYPSIYLYSKSGLGKTHLLHATANAIRDKDPRIKICFITAQKFVQEMVEAVKSQKVDDFRRKYTTDLDVLMIDDIHELKNKQGTQNAFFHVFNDLYGQGKQLIFTSDKGPKEIDGIEERIKTRLSWGLVLDIQRPDLETRIAILKAKAQDEDIFIPDEVINLIASCVKDSIRELEGSLIKLAAYSSIFKQDIDMEIARRELRLDDCAAPQNLTLEKVARAVSQHYKLPIADLKSKSRLKAVAQARHIAMHLSYQLLGTNLIEIGKFYGGRDHTTVMHGISKVKTALASDSSLSQVVLKIENHLT